MKAPGTSGSPGTIPSAYPIGRSPATDIAAALALSKVDKLPVLIDFGADWCPDCVVLNKLYRSSIIEPVLTTRYHLVLVDVGRFDKNLTVAKKYINLETSGIPALVVLHSNGLRAYASNDGAFSSARTMTAHELLPFLDKWSTA